ncbi:MAG: tetratricopeptide repeat protein [Nanoarchaeota archaeon]|nr:tetratricopeptide repeat protein [Nanoarchaeota archaeon]
MRVKEVTKREIEKKFVEMNDYLRIEYLKSCLQNQLDFDTKKFVLVKLAGLYEAKGMLLEAGKAMRTAAEINTFANTKVMDYIKAAELYIRGGDYDRADAVKQKAIDVGGETRKDEIEKTFREYYKIQARVCVEVNKRKQAAGVYEKMLTMDLDLSEKKEVQENLIAIYEAFGEFTKVRSLRRKIPHE